MCCSCLWIIIAVQSLVIINCRNSRVCVNVSFSHPAAYNKTGLTHLKRVQLRSASDFLERSSSDPVTWSGDLTSCLLFCCKNFYCCSVVFFLVFFPLTFSLIRALDFVDFTSVFDGTLNICILIFSLSHT